MNRLTKDDVKEMGMVELSHNQVFIKNGEAWYRDYERKISIRDLVKEMFEKHGVEYSENIDEFDEDMMYSIEDDFETITGIIALLYRALWSMAEVREKLKEYEDIGVEPEQIKSFLKDFGVSVVMRNTKLMNELKRYKDLEEQLFYKYDELRNKTYDDVENYTTGYKYGHRNGQLELLEQILNIETGAKKEAEKGGNNEL